jgi:hypothetical protein
MEENERKPIFTNTHRTSRETYLQFFHGARKTANVIVCAVAAAILAFICYESVTVIRSVQYYGGSIFAESFFWIGILGIALWLFIPINALFIAPKRFAKRQMRMSTEAYGTEQMDIVTEFFDDAAELHNLTSKGEARFTYPTIKKVTETKDLFLAWTGTKQILIINKLGFDGTDIVGFRAFMDEKCPHAKRKWRKAE